MAKIDGNLLRVYVSGVAVGGTTSYSFDISKDIQETTNQDSAGNTEYHPTAGKVAGKGSVDGFYDPLHILNIEEIMDRILNNSGLATFQVGSMGTGNTNNPYYEFTGLIDTGGWQVKNDAVVTMKFSFVSSGAITKKISTGSAGS